MEDIKPLKTPEEIRKIIQVECNLEEFPYFRLSDKKAKSLAEIHFNRTIKTLEGILLEQTLAIKASGNSGLPGPFDQDVLIAIQEQINTKGLNNEKYLHFSLYKLIEIMKKNHSGWNYQAVKESIKRMVGTTIVSENAFYNKGIKKHLTDILHLFERAIFYDECKRKGLQPEFEFNVLTLSEWFLANLKAHYTKPLDINFYYNLNLPTARRLYRWLDKKRYGDKKSFYVDLPELALTMPLSERYPSDIRRALEPAHQELLQKKFLKKVDYEKEKKTKQWRVVYHFSPKVIFMGNMTQPQFQIGLDQPRWQSPPTHIQEEIKSLIQKLGEKEEKLKSET